MKQSKITFVGDKVELITPHQHKDKIVASIAKHRLDEESQGNALVRNAGPNAGTTMIAIYEFEGPDQYKICFDPAGVAVPKSSAPSGIRTYLAHLEAGKAVVTRRQKGKSSDRHGGTGGTLAEMLTFRLSSFILIGICRVRVGFRRS